MYHTSYDIAISCRNTHSWCNDQIVQSSDRQEIDDSAIIGEYMCNKLKHTWTPDRLTRQRNGNLNSPILPSSGRYLKALDIQGKAVWIFRPDTKDVAYVNGSNLLYLRDGAVPRVVHVTRSFRWKSYPFNHWGAFFEESDLEPLS